VRAAESWSFTYEDDGVFEVLSKILDATVGRRKSQVSDARRLKVQRHVWSHVDHVTDAVVVKDAAIGRILVVA